MLPADLHSILQRRLAVKHSIASSSSHLALASVLTGENHRARAGLQDAVRGTAALQQAWRRTFVCRPEVQASASRSTTNAVELAEQPAAAQVTDTSFVTEAQQSYLSVRNGLG